MKTIFTLLIISIFSTFSLAQTGEKSGENDLSKASKIYPNPNNGNFTMVIPFDDIFREPAEYIIYDELGRTVLKDRAQVRANEIFVVTSFLPAGQYYIRVWKKEEVVTQPFSIDKL